MRRILVAAVIIVMAFGFTVQAHADLTLLGQGTSTHGTYNLIYDTDLDITWYDYSKPRDTWWNQVDWAEGLSVNFGGAIFDDWRLPITSHDGVFEYGYDGTTIIGYNITNSEMGHLFYTELGNKGFYSTDGRYQSDYGLTNTGDFQNLESSYYWSGTESIYLSNDAWRISYGDGYQGGDGRIANFYAIAVMDGMAVVPEPISSTLFIVGGATLGFRRFKRSG